jgi:energy-coupling factor transporter ATP-binding protein EcfA2
MFLDPATIAGVSWTVLEHRKRLLPSLRKLRYWLTHGRLQVAIFGPGGTGKSTLGEFLAGNLDLASSSGKYKQSINVERYALKGDLVCKLIVPPGQHRRALTTWPDLYRSLANGKSGGVINVVSWGHHSFAESSLEETKYFEAGMTKSDFLNKYLEATRQRELEIIRDLTPRLLDAKQRIWMITLVTKQDLWWNERSKVEDFYTKGQYNEFIERILHERGAQNFSHEYLSTSLVINNLVTGAGELLAPTTEGYDQNIQYAHLEKLLETVTNFGSR